MKTIQGRKYIFMIETSGTYFAIKAQCKSTGRFSHINNLNAILSEIGVDRDDPRVADSMWVVTKEGARNLGETAKPFLLDPSFRDYLERQLDEDRMLGEWENKAVRTKN